MNIHMKYGKTGLSLDLPGDIDVTLIQKETMPVIKDPEGAINAAFSNPVNGKTLREEAKGCRNCCILICDITRPVPNSLILPVLVKELLHAGTVSYTHLRAHETDSYLVCRLLLEKK